MSRQQYLQSLWDTLKRPEYAAAVLEFRPFRGWFLVYDEPAHFGDEGNYIGWWWKEAAEQIEYLCGKRAT